MRNYFIRVFSVLCTASLGGVEASAQELNCSVQIYYDKIQSQTEKKVMEALQQSIIEFMNNRKWTTDQFKPEEKIFCNLIITLTDKLSADEFKGSMQVQASRSIFNTSYKSLIVNLNDQEVHFRYLEYQTMEFSESSNLANLTSILAFYAYMILGTDYDTYSLEGGTPYFQKAQTIVE